VNECGDKRWVCVVICCYLSSTVPLNIVSLNGCKKKENMSANGTVRVWKHAGNSCVSVCKKHTICLCSLLVSYSKNDCACVCRLCVCVCVSLCGWWSPRPSGARLPAVTGARLKLGDQKDEWWRDVAASAAGAAGVKRDAALNNHRGAFCLGRACLDLLPVHFQLRPDHQRDRWPARASDISPSSKHSDIVSDLLSGLLQFSLK